ncbi:MAG: COX15/CtaA family protein [Magnetospiraceae bacterium]
MTETAHRRQVVARWLFVICAMVFVMVMLGGVTRLTESGLSIVNWRPATGWLPPLSAAEWQALFDLYKNSPEFQEVNSWMTVADFKSIFWMEYLHRLWGRLIGIAYFVPMVFFVLRGYVDRSLTPKLVFMFVLGGFQGVLGWYMVQSGLVDQPDVSQYRLTAHLAAALIVYGYMFWVALGLMAPPPLTPVPAAQRRFALVLPALVFITLLSGGFVAGLNAGFTYNTFPLMDGRLVPDGAYGLTPWWRSAFEDIGTVQFNHRVLALTTFAVIVGFFLRARRHAGFLRPAHSLAGLAFVQVCLGIATLLLVVPTPLAALHQAVGVLVFTAALWTAHRATTAPA